MALPACRGRRLVVTGHDAARIASDAIEDASLHDSRVDAADIALPHGAHRVWPVDLANAFTLPGGTYVSPMRIVSRGESQILVVGTEGLVAALDPNTGTPAWTVQIPVPAGLGIAVVAPPALVEQSLVVSYQFGNAVERTNHLVSVIDLESRALDRSYATLELTASVPDNEGRALVTFRPAYALSRAALEHVRDTDGHDLVYAAFGNLRDIQPWHGWVFEIDLQKWHSLGPASAVTGVLLTTPESDCGPDDESGGRETVCGGGVWAPSGPRAVRRPDGSFDLLVPTGNGELDLSRRDYANTIMRTGRGLRFDPECDERACASFRATLPSADCIESCRNLLVPRLRDVDAPYRPGSGGCDGRSLLECYAALDLDFGSSTPAMIDLGARGRMLLVPAKDGAIYLSDYERFGRLYDRLQIVGPCGTSDSHCSAEWAGMMVTEPVVTTLDGEPIALVQTFVPDDVHAAGMTAVRVATDGVAPALERLWTAPSVDSPAARRYFRLHPSRIGLGTLGGEQYAWVVDVVPAQGPDDHGRLLGVRVRDGAIVANTPMLGAGQRYTVPLGDNHRVVGVSTNAGRGIVEAFAADPDTFDPDPTR
jgi:hypothetical protein